jgi:hypothetical protein
MSGRTPDEADLAEFDRLREEIDNRTELSTNLILAEIAALGAAISVIEKVHDVLLGLPVLGSFLWLLWMDHTQQIYKIGLYIAQDLAPRIRQSHPNSFGWEKFFRVLDKGGPGGAEAGQGSGLKVRHTVNVFRYIAFLFGWTSPVFLALYGFIELINPLKLLLHCLSRDSLTSCQPDYAAIFRFIGFVAAWMVWGYAYAQYGGFRKAVQEINGLVVQEGVSAELKPPQNQTRVVEKQV